MTTHVSPEQLRPPALMAEKEQFLEMDREFLRTNRHRWVLVACPACGLDLPVSFGEKHGFPFVSCSDCGTAYMSPRPDAALLAAFYQQSANYRFWNKHIYPASAATRLERIFRPRAKQILALLADAGIEARTLVEVGAGHGLFCEALRDTGAIPRIIAIEPTPDLAGTCRSKGLETLEAVIEAVPDDLRADVAVSFEVIEHLFEPEGFVRACGHMLPSGGLLVLSCPNVQGFDMQLLGLLSDSFNHQHLNYFHPNSITRLLRRCGFETMSVRTPGQLDAAMVRNKVLAGSYDLSERPFLRHVLLEHWEELGGGFQDFLAASGLSSHMWVVARKAT